MELRRYKRIAFLVIDSGGNFFIQTKSHQPEVTNRWGIPGKQLEDEFGNKYHYELSDPVLKMLVRVADWEEDAT